MGYRSRSLAALGFAIASLLLWSSASSAGLLIADQPGDESSCLSCHQMQDCHVQDPLACGELGAGPAEPETGEPTATAIPEATPQIETATPVLTVEPSPSIPSRDQATFTLCGDSDPQLEREVEQLIGGRSFNSRLVSRSDGCADLTITVGQQPRSGYSGSQNVSLTVSAGSMAGTPGRVISIRIVTENGVTRVSIGAAR